MPVMFRRFLCVHASYVPMLVYSLWQLCVYANYASCVHMQAVCPCVSCQLFLNARGMCEVCLHYMPLSLIMKLFFSNGEI